MQNSEDPFAQNQSAPDRPSWVEADAGRPAKTENSWLPTCLVGCLVLLMVFVIVGAIGGYLAATKGPLIAARFVRTKAADQIRSSDLPADEKDELIRQLDRVVVAFENGELDKDDLERVAKELAKSPIVVAGLLMGAEEKYFNPSGLTDVEKEQARKAIQRIWRGSVEKKIDSDDLKPAFEIIAEKKGENEWRLKSTLTDEELREFTSSIEQVADEHGIPDEAFEVRVSAEVRRLVDKLLNEETSPQDSATPAESSVRGSDQQWEAESG